MEITTLDSLYAPPAEADSPWLLVVAHGRGDSIDGFTWMPSVLGIDRLGYLMVNAPDPWWGGYSWYDLPPDQEQGIVRSRKLLDQLFDEIAAQRGGTAKVMFFGFSQGCMMALEWGARTRHQLAGFVGISGYCLDPAAIASEATEHARNTPWLVTHGTRDDVLPFHRSERQIVELQRDAGLPIEWHAYEKEHTIDPTEEIAMIRHWLAARTNDSADS